MQKKVTLQKRAEKKSTLGAYQGDKDAKRQ
jgi:hypothetical protein